MAASRAAITIHAHAISWARIDASLRKKVKKNQHAIPRARAIKTLQQMPIATEITHRPVARARFGRSIAILSRIEITTCDDARISAKAQALQLLSANHLFELLHHRHLFRIDAIEFGAMERGPVSEGERIEDLVNFVFTLHEHDFCFESPVAE
jgi:hypothetical protein